MSRKAIHINSSGRTTDSITRKISADVINHLQQQHPELSIIERDLGQGVPFISNTWIGANFTAAAERNSEQHQVLQHSDLLIEEVQQADYVVIASPIYNFSVPAVLKAWIDQVARAQVTFKYTEQGPVGLLKNKKAILVMASGGVPIESEMDFATPYLRQVMRFLGINDITVIDANQAQSNVHWSVADSLQAIEKHTENHTTTV